jgi:DNA-binding CsgD family transcriptional regulator
LEIEHDNLLAALHWASESKNIDAGLRLAESLSYFWFVHGYIREGVSWLDEFLESTQDVSSALVARGLAYLGTLLRAINEDNDQESAMLYEKGLSIFRELNDRSGVAWVLNQMGLVALQRGELVAAEQHLNESLALQKELGDPWDIAFTMQNLPPLELLNGDLKKAREYAEEEVAWFEQAGDLRGIARSLTDFADIARLEGDFTHAVTLLTQALPQIFQLGDRVSIANLLESLAILAAKQRKYKRGALLLGAAEALREEIGMPYRGLKYEDYHQAEATIQKYLNESNFEQSWSKGRGMSLEQIFDYLMGETNLHTMKYDATAEEKIWFQLTVREHDVMRLLAEGHSNFEISQKLFLSEKTVRNYISNIYHKLHIASRGKAILLARKLVSTSEE